MIKFLSMLLFFLFVRVNPPAACGRSPMLATATTQLPTPLLHTVHYTYPTLIYSPFSYPSRTNRGGNTTSTRVRGN